MNYRGSELKIGEKDQILCRKRRKGKANYELLVSKGSQWLISGLWIQTCFQMPFKTFALKRLAIYTFLRNGYAFCINRTFTREVR